MTKAEFVDYLRSLIARQTDQTPTIEMVEHSGDAGLMVETRGTRFQIDVRITGPNIHGAVHSEQDVDAEHITRAINASIEETRINGKVSPDKVRQSLDELYARKRADRDATRQAFND